MFNAISWNQFFIAIISVTVVYYFVTILLLYSNELNSLFKKHSATPSNERKPTPSQINDEPSLMGQVRHSHVDDVVSRGEILDQQLLSINSPTEPDETPDDLVNVRSYYSLIDIATEEINTLIEVITGQSKEESVGLFKSLLSRHDSLDREQRDLVSITLYNQCKSRCRFSVELSEILTWWPTSESNNQSSNL